MFWLCCVAYEITTVFIISDYINILFIYLFSYRDIIKIVFQFLLGDETSTVKIEKKLK